MDLGATKAPMIRRSYLCKQLRQLIRLYTTGDCGGLASQSNIAGLVACSDASRRRILQPKRKKAARDRSRFSLSRWVTNRGSVRTRTASGRRSAIAAKPPQRRTTRRAVLTRAVLSPPRPKLRANRETIDPQRRHRQAIDRCRDFRRGHGRLRVEGCDTGCQHGKLLESATEENSTRNHECACLQQ
jgi:hypothetical protein